MTQLESRNPSTGELLGSVPITPMAELREAVSRARNAQPNWADLALEERCKLLSKLAPLLSENESELARLLTREMGKPLREATFELRSCAQGIDPLLAEIAEALAPESVDHGSSKSIIYRDPLGVAAVITPWNFPVSMPHWMILPALAAGNTVVFKPSEETPLIAQAYADLLISVLPRNVLQVVHGAGEEGQALVAADVDLIAFTGSRETGKHIMAEASKTLKRLVLELGGKDPLIVLDSADLQAAAKFAARNSFRNAGQVCVSTERIFVSSAIAEDFVDLLANQVANFKVGDGLDEGVRVGPMVSKRQRAHVLAQIDDAVGKGATVVAGDAEGPGQFVNPTVISGVTEAMELASGETFGPVAAVTVVEHTDEAIARANSTRFGLGAVVFGEAGEAARVARRLSAGMIGINRGVGGGNGTPWVGARESGYGFHGSKDGHRNFTQTRLITEAASKS